MTTSWAKDALFYHIYPLGLCGAPFDNDLDAPRVYRLEKLYAWLDHIQSLGANALYLGPLFQSSSHGYDTIDYYQVDRRLGDNHTLAKLSDALHERGMRLILDAVFNHVGRGFWAFRDVLEKGEDSAYCDWFHNLRFDEHSPKGDPFKYEGWNGHYSLVKLNLSHPDVRAHLFDAVGMWMGKFKIDGLRLDAADCIDFDFLRALHTFTKSRQPNFWLMGEIVHGDYRQWMNPDTLDSVTNYECYKGLYSSLNDANYFEIAYNLNRQFGEEGLYRGSYLYNFVDNHDVDRVASKLENPAHLYPLYLLLFTMPGIPSIYYGSEWGVMGIKEKWTDEPLRPALDLEQLRMASPHPDLLKSIRRLAALRESTPALRYGTYRPSHVDHEQFAFIRELGSNKILVVLNSAEQPVDLELELPWKSGELLDLLETDTIFRVQEERTTITLPPTWGRILNFRE